MPLSTTATLIPAPVLPSHAHSRVIPPFGRSCSRCLMESRPKGGITREWAWEGSTGAGIKVAVVDSGIDAGHPAVGAVAGYAGIVERDGKIAVDTQPHQDDYGHGTACAGIIRAV